MNTPALVGGWIIEKSVLLSRYGHAEYLEGIL